MRGSSRTRQHIILAMSLAGVFLWTSSAPAAEEATAAEPTQLELGHAVCPGDDTASQDYRWCFFAGNMTNFPRLKDASDRVDREVNKTLRLIAPGFDDVKSFGDQRDDVMIHTPFLGFGRILNDYFDVFLQAGYTRGVVETKATDWSLLLVPLRTNVTFERSSFFLGLGTHWHPWGRPVLMKYDGWKARVRGTKPFFATSVNWNYLTFDADVKGAFFPLGNILHIEQSDIFKVWSWSALVGVDMPLTKHTCFSYNVNYNTFFRYGDDFSGPSMSVYMKYLF